MTEQTVYRHDEKIDNNKKVKLTFVLTSRFLSDNNKAPIHKTFMREFENIKACANTFKAWYEIITDTEEQIDMDMYPIETDNIAAFGQIHICSTDIYNNICEDWIIVLSYTDDEPSYIKISFDELIELANDKVSDDIYESIQKDKDLLPFNFIML